VLSVYSVVKIDLYSYDIVSGTPRATRHTSGPRSRIQDSDPTIWFGHINRDSGPRCLSFHMILGPNPGSWNVVRCLYRPINADSRSG
jgi:hypothetical protein